MDAARLLETLNHQGLTLFAQGARLIVRPGNLLTANDETLIREHKQGLLRLLREKDAATLAAHLEQTGPAGLDWREGTPADWGDARLLAAGEVLYVDGRMAGRNGRRYLRECAPPVIAVGSEYRPPDSPPDRPPDAPPDPLAERIAELQAAGWSAWNARARAESETLPG